MAPAQPAPSGRANRVNQAAQYALLPESPMMRQRRQSAEFSLFVPLSRPGLLMSKAPPSARSDLLRSILDTRIAILDGAMGTMVHQLGLDEAGFRGQRFASHHRDL